MTQLFNSKFDFEYFINEDRHYGPPHGNVVCEVDEPEKYPCVLVYELRVDDNGPDYISGEYVYLDDFNLDND